MSVNTATMKQVSNEYRDSYAQGVADRRANRKILTKVLFLATCSGMDRALAADLYYCYSQGYRNAAAVVANGR